MYDSLLEYQWWQGERFSNTARKPQLTNDSSKNLASVDDRCLQNIKWICHTNYVKRVCVLRKRTQYYKSSGHI